MPTLDKHQSNEYIKLLFIGDSKAGKTTALASLVEADYKIRILDFDNLLDPLKHQVMSRCPEKAGNVEYRTLRDKRTMSAAGPMIASPKAFVDSIKLLDRWKYDDVDLGVPSNWGPDCVLVIDSLSRLCDAAFDWQLPLTPKGGKSGEIDKRMTYFNAQNAVEDVLAMLTSATFATNVIVICHGIYMDLPDGTTKIFPQGCGQKLSPKIPQYFPSYIRIKNQGGKRSLQLVSDAMIDLACPRAVDTKTLDVETGVAEFFELLLGKNPTQAPKPKLVRKV